MGRLGQARPAPVPQRPRLDAEPPARPPPRHRPPSGDCGKLAAVARAEPRRTFARIGASGGLARVRAAAAVGEGRRARVLHPGRGRRPRLLDGPRGGERLRRGGRLRNRPVLGRRHRPRTVEVPLRQPVRGADGFRAAFDPFGGRRLRLLRGADGHPPLPPRGYGREGLAARPARGVPRRDAAIRRLLLPAGGRRVRLRHAGRTRRRVGRRLPQADRRPCLASPRRPHRL